MIMNAAMIMNADMETNAGIYAGLIQDAHMALHDIYAGNRVKELLAQGIVNMRNQERSAEELAIQKRRQTPFHMHINIDMLECVYFLCCMLLEVPAMAQGESSKRRFFSKKFGSQLNYYRRSSFIGPPEHSRDHIIAASLALLEANWKECTRLVMKLKIWKLFPNANAVSEMITKKIQEEGLRTYVVFLLLAFDNHPPPLHHHCVCVCVCMGSVHVTAPLPPNDQSGNGVWVLWYRIALGVIHVLTLGICFYFYYIFLSIEFLYFCRYLFV